MFSWLRRHFSTPKVESLQLHVEVDRSENGHLVRLEKEVAGMRETVDSLDSLGVLGYQEIVEDDAGLTVYQVAKHDLETVQALRSATPTQEDDAFTFPFAPPMLSYLRSQPSVKESDASAELHVSDEALTPTAHVSYDSAHGMTVEAGYEVPGEERLLNSAELPRTGDGEYVLVGNAFRRIKEPASKAAQSLLSQATLTVNLQDVPEFFLRDLVVIRNEFNAVLTDAAEAIEIVDRPMQSKVKVEKSDDGWLQFAVSYQAGRVEIPAAMMPKVLSKNKMVRVDDNTWVKVDPKAVAAVDKELERLNAQVTEAGYRVPVAQFASLEEFISKLGGLREVNQAYTTFLSQLEGFVPNEDYRLSAAAENHLLAVGIQLRPYQRSGIHWLNWLRSNYLHGILADDMGLGKTLQTICLLRKAYEINANATHSLVIAPASVLPHWEREIKHFFPAASVYRYHGANRRRDLLHSRVPIIFVSTYATVANDIETLLRVPLFYLVLDEATYIKNPTSKRAQMIKRLNSAHRLCLSGTPVENRPAEIWSLFDFLMRGHLGKYGTFKRVFENPITSGDAAASGSLGSRIRPFMLRRLKQEVAKDLPEKIEIDEWCALSKEQAQLYAALQGEVKQIYEKLNAGEYVNYTASILPVLTKLKQICNHPAILTKDDRAVLGRSNKFDWIIDKVAEILARGEQVVIFSHFLGMLTLFERALRAKGWRYIRLDGSVSRRQERIDRFNAREVPIALCSIQATGYGINLTAANHVIHADRWWNPAVEDQATDRVHRIGQDKNVYVYRILVQDTLEERIDQLLIGKREMAGQIMGAAKQGGRTWSRDDLLKLLSPLDG